MASFDGQRILFLCLWRKTSQPHGAYFVGYLSTKWMKVYFGCQAIELGHRGFFFGTVCRSLPPILRLLAFLPPQICAFGEVFLMFQWLSHSFNPTSQGYVVRAGNLQEQTMLLVAGLLLGHLDFTDKHKPRCLRRFVVVFMLLHVKVILHCHLPNLQLLAWLTTRTPAPIRRIFLMFCP